MTEHSETGFYCYVATPYNAAGDVDVDVLHDYVDEMITAEVDGITCVASTCDGPYLTERERRLVVETVGKAVGGRVGLNVGVAAVSTRQVVEYARHARDHGATNLMIEMQQYLPISFDAMRRHYEDIAAAVDLPIRLYNLPIPTRIDLLPSMVRDLSAIEAIRSVKDASGDATRLTQIRAACGDRLTLFCGLHFNLLEGMRAKAEGWEVTLHPLFARPVVQLYRQVAMDPWSESSRAAFMRWSPLFLFFRQLLIKRA